MVDKNFTPSREELTDLRDQGLNREEIAAHYDVTLSRVKRWLKKQGFNRPERRVLVDPVNVPVADLPFDHGMTMIERAKAALGNRLAEDRHRGYLLDGRVTSSEKVIEAARLKPVKRG